MFRLTLILVLACVLVMDADGWFFRRRRRRRVVQITRHKSINNCHCTVHHHHYHGRMAQLLRDVRETNKSLDRRDVAAILDLDEDYPGLDQFVNYLSPKRGVADMDNLDGLFKRARHYSTSHSPSRCYCGRALMDQFNMETLS